MSVGSETRDTVALETAKPQAAVEPCPEATDAPAEILRRLDAALAAIGDQLEKSEIPTLAKVAGLFREHETDLATFLSSDPKGKLIPGFLGQLAEELRLEWELLRQEHEHLAIQVKQLRRIGQGAKRSSANSVTTPAQPHAAHVPGEPLSKRGS